MSTVFGCPEDVSPRKKRPVLGKDFRHEKKNAKTPLGGLERTLDQSESNLGSLGPRLFLYLVLRLLETFFSLGSRDLGNVIPLELYFSFIFRVCLLCLIIGTQEFDKR